MPNDIERNASAQRRTSKLLAAMGIFVALGIIAYIILTLLVNRSVPANPGHPLHRHKRRFRLL